MSYSPTGSFGSAVHDFHVSRRRAAMEEIMARLTGKSADLLSFEEVSRKLRAGSKVDRGLQNVPLDSIVGSVGRYTDFTRSFLPRQASDEQRWARVKVGVSDLKGLPPVELYQIGEAYFVLDGNHRISVARAVGATHIEAYVKEVQTKVKLTSDVGPDELIIKAEYADFLVQTGIDQLCPDADLLVTIPGQYRKLKEHIDVHRYFMGIDQQRDIPYKEAVAHWYDEVYLPIVQVIREKGILRDFPGRTETDLYLWLSKHRAELGNELGWEVPAEKAATDLVSRYSPTFARAFSRIKAKALGWLIPDAIESGPEPGIWRQERAVTGQEESLFRDILVPISDADPEWSALNEAIEIARCENGQLHGLMVMQTDEKEDEEWREEKRIEFIRRCEEAGISGDFAFEIGKIEKKIRDRGRWTDLIVLHVAHPPGDRLQDRLSSGLHTLIRRSGRPVLTVFGNAHVPRRILLAFDGSPKSREALYIATYMAGKWKARLTVLTIAARGHLGYEQMRQARNYLKTHGVNAHYVHKFGRVDQCIIRTSEQDGSHLILVGGYGVPAIKEVALGSTVDHLIRNTTMPLLICY